MGLIKFDKILGEIRENDLAGITNPFQYKGEINANSDFPTSAEVESGWFYTIGTDVTDNDPTKTNTGQSFLAGDEIVWNGTDWTVIGYSDFIKKDGTTTTTASIPFAYGLSSLGEVTVGVNGTGHDVTFFGATAGKKFLWDESEDRVAIDGDLSCNGLIGNTHDNTQDYFEMGFYNNEGTPSIEKVKWEFRDTYATISSSTGISLISWDMGFKIKDNYGLTMGSSNDITIGYDETTTDKFLFSNSSDLGTNNRTTMDPTTGDWDFLSGNLTTTGTISALGYKDNIVTKTEAYTATDNDDAILCNGTFTITLPASSGVSGKIFYIKNIGTGVITVDGNSGETIDGDLTKEMDYQYSDMEIISDGSNWHIL